MMDYHNLNYERRKLKILFKIGSYRILVKAKISTEKHIQHQNQLEITETPKRKSEKSY